MTATAAPDPIGDLDRLLRELLMSLQAVFVRRAEEAGITLLQATTLQVLRTPMTMGALAELLDCDASTVTSLADRLERLGLVERRLGETDRRVKILGLTPMGEALRRELDASVVRELFDLRGLSFVDVERLTASLQGIMLGPFVGEGIARARPH